MTKQQDCPLCGEPIEDAPAIHDIVKCEKTELIKGRETILKLKDSLSSWKDTWFHQREIIADLWWRHPAIDDDAERAYYQNNLKQLAAEKQQRK